MVGMEVILLLLNGSFFIEGMRSSRWQQVSTQVSISSGKPLTLKKQGTHEHSADERVSDMIKVRAALLKTKKRIATQIQMKFGFSGEALLP